MLRESNSMHSVMSEHVHPAESCIPLSAALMNDLQNLTPAALKVYLLLRSLNRGQRVVVGVPAIAAGIGLKERSVISGLRLLKESGLILCNRGRGNHPNTYSFPDLCDTAVSSPPPAEGAVLPSFQTPKLACEPVPARNQSTLQEQLASVYRPLSVQEVTALQEVEPNEAVLRTKLRCLRSVPRCVTFDRFVSVIKTAIY